MRQCQRCLAADFCITSANQRWATADNVAGAHARHWAMVKRSKLCAKCTIVRMRKGQDSIAAG